MKLFGTKEAPAGLVTAPEVTASIHENGIVFFDKQQGVLFSSNRIGALVWQAADRRQSLDGITAQVAREFDVPFDEVAADAAQFLAELERNGIMRRTRN